LFYEVESDSGPKIELAAADVFHLRGFGHGPVGVSVADYAAQTLGWARAAQLFGAAFFGNGMSTSGVVVNKTKLSEEGLKLQKAQFEQGHRGVHRSHKTYYLDNDATWIPMSVDPSKAQMVEVHHFLVDEICRIFGVPPHIVAELTRSTNNNIEHQSIEAVQRCLTPWVKRLEDEADNKLFGAVRDRGFFTKINMLGLLRGDFKSQAEGFRIYREMGVVNANEIRERLDMNKMLTSKGGDKFTMNSAYSTLEQIGELPVVPVAPPPDPVEPEPKREAENAFSFDDLLAIENIKINELVNDR
jgi:HK97 family phage portal protein